MAKKSTEIRWLLLFMAMPLLSGSAMAWWAWQQRDFLLALAPWGWLGLFVALAVPIAFSLIPNTLAGLLAGYFIGWWGLLGITLSFLIASLLGYFFGRSVDSGMKQSIFQLWPTSEKTIQLLEKQSVFVVMLFRLSPAPPFAIGSLLLSWFRLPIPIFLMGSLAGMLPRMAIVIWLGIQAKDIVFLLQHPGGSKEMQGLGLVLLVVVGLGIWMLKNKIKAKF